MFTFNKDVTPTNCEPGVTRKILCYSDDLMMCEIHFEKGSKGNFHSHKHLQITYVAKGDGILCDVFNPMREDFLK